ncbi:MAG: FHA domain-containing protein [Lysobacter sp.]
MDGVELVLLGPSPRPLPDLPAVEPGVLRHVVLRGVGGTHHGKSFNLDRACVVGRLAESEVCIAEPGFPDSHSRLEPHPEGIVLRDLGSPAGSVVNGHPVREGLLRPGDQIVFGANQRFVLEAPRVPTALAAAAPAAMEISESSATAEPARSPVASSLRRMPWLLLAAVLLAGALALLLLYGAR